jgi:hypothetical protein
VALSVCPAAFVKAPLNHIWAILLDPSSYDRWWDATTERIEPAGPAQPGQRIEASSRGWGVRWPLTTRLEAIEEGRHALELQTSFPLGFTIRNRISCSSVDWETTRVQFG